MFNILIVAIVTVTLAGSTATAAPVGIVNDQSHSATFWVWSPVANAWTKTKVKPGQNSLFEVDESQMAYVVVETNNGDFDYGWLDFTGLIENAGDLTYVLRLEFVTEVRQRTVERFVKETVTVFIRGRKVTRTYLKPVVYSETYTVELPVFTAGFFDSSVESVYVPTFDDSPPPLPRTLR